MVAPVGPLSVPGIGGLPYLGVAGTEREGWKVRHCRYRPCCGQGLVGHKPSTREEYYR
jgi:hypothetical protein